MYLNYFGKTFCDIWWKGDFRRKNVSDIECQETFVPFNEKKSAPHWKKVTKLDIPGTWQAQIQCLLLKYVKRISKWSWKYGRNRFPISSILYSYIFLYKLNETFRGCIIANIWASQLHFIFQRYIFLDSPTFPTLVVLHYNIIVCEWIFVCYLFCSRYFLRSQQ